MTNKKAIKNIKEHCYFSELNPDTRKSLDIAIEALEKLEKIKFEVNWLDNVKKTEFNYKIAFDSIKKIIWDWSD